MTIKNAKVFRQGEFVREDVAISGEIFSHGAGEGEVLDGAGCYAIPGLIDIHFHGCVGADFSDAPMEEMERMAQYQAAQGVTAICPATMTLPEEDLAKACRRMACLAAKQGAELVGINLEGPFLSPNRLGAQNPAYVRAPDPALYHRLQEAAEGRVKLLAIAPEMEGAMELIDQLGEEVGCSVAHTEAGYDLARQAFDRGARQVTHLFNAMPPLNHRDPGVIGGAADSPHVMAELICDGVHIHPSAVRAAFRLFGAERLIFISDSMMATGLGDGEYQLGGLPVSVRGNTARLTQGGNIAGSVTNLMDCLRVAVTQMEIPLGTAVRCATANPAKAIGVYGRRGSIQAGKVADLVLLNPDLTVRQVILRGRPL